jgi:uncharacterized membrane protein YbaN (DUF454 family)
MNFDLWNRPLKIWECTGALTPKVKVCGVHLGVWGVHLGVWGVHLGVWGVHLGVWGVHLGVCGFIPSHFPTLPGV